MLSELKGRSSEQRVVGVKQTKRALLDGNAAQVFLAGDADPRVIEPVARLCEEKGVPVARTASMKELGAACGIAVGSAAAALLR
ncbi:MAG: 50S ribosomal protein L7ae-like protein [Oscillospiraceae bacterium]|nr:50S ribosomal protein L7ae-like protein [Oscillospiraceae bacterium]